MDGGLPRDTSVRLHLAPLQSLLQDPDVTEIAINGPNLVFAEKSGIWTRCELPGGFSAHAAHALGVAIARLSDQIWNEQYPLLSASTPALPIPNAASDEMASDVASRELRFQLVGPPAVAPEHYSVTIRKPALVERSLGDFARDGLFERVRANDPSPLGNDQRLLELLSRKRHQEFLREAVVSRKNIVVAGATGSGKTTFMKALVREIPPSERIITIEDVRELTLPHPNKVHLLYSKGKQSGSDVTAKDLLEACLRMKPDRILLAEVRGDECLYYVRNAASGHPGSITSVHAGSPALALEQMAIMIKDSPGGAHLDFSVIQRLLVLTVDVIVQFEVQNGKRFMSEIYFAPERKHAAPA
ncbi:MAG: P-type DNA transfer ATPase VirB11 [Burkholderiaceae bacterium]